jgi:carboxyl-terminal processing protease
MKVTTGMYFLPSGESTQQKGVAADIVVPSLLSAFDMGEKDLDYSLPPQSTVPFLSEDVNGKGKNRWRPVERLTIRRLAKRSAERVEEKPLFEEIEKELEEAKEKRSVIHLQEMMTGEEGGAEGEDDDEASRYERMEEAFVDEAVDVAVDLVRLRAPETLGARDPTGSD